MFSAGSQAVTQKSLTDLSSPCLEEGSMTRWRSWELTICSKGELSVVMASVRSIGLDNSLPGAINMKSNKSWGTSGKRNGLAQGLGHGNIGRLEGDNQKGEHHQFLAKQ